MLEFLLWNNNYEYNYNNNLQKNGGVLNLLASEMCVCDNDFVCLLFFFYQNTVTKLKTSNNRCLLSTKVYNYNNNNNNKNKFLLN